jgi:hypothetical protein
MLGCLVAGSRCINYNSSINHIIASIYLTIGVYFEILTNLKGFYAILITIAFIIKSLTVQTAPKTGS